MFGMSSTDFWENDPQLYWAYRTFYLKQKEEEIEEMRYESWLKGSINFLSTSLAIRKNFSKEVVTYPTYEEMYGKEKIDKKKDNKKKTRKEIDMLVQQENISWARY